MQDFRTTTFLTVCRTMNYTRAAEELHISQPAVSQHIAYLERDYGTKLFVHKNRTLHLTKAGELLKGALTVIAHDDQLLRERIATLESDRRINLRLGTTLTAGQYVVAAPLAAHLAAHPEIRIDLRSGDTAALLKLLDEGDVDCAFVEGFFDSRPYQHKVLCNERLCAVAAPSRPFGADPLSLEDLLGIPLVVREPGSGTRAVLEHALAAENLSLDSFDEVAEAGSINIIKVLVAADLGISFMYESAVRRELHEGTLREIPLAGPPITHPIAFIHLRGSAFEDEYEELFAAVKAHLSAN